METIIVSSSKSPQQNTLRVAHVLGDALEAKILSPEQATPGVLARANRIGFGSGIYSMSFDPALAQCIRSLPDMTGRDAFVFATSGLPEPPFPRYTRRLARLLRQSGFRVVGTFTCRGVDTWGPFGLIGGVSKGRPDRDDLDRARDFAESIAR